MMTTHEVQQDEGMVEERSGESEEDGSVDDGMVPDKRTVGTRAAWTGLNNTAGATVPVSSLFRLPAPDRSAQQKS